MKRSYARFLAAAASLIVAAQTNAQSLPPRAIFFSSRQWPPGPALYVATPGSSSGTPAGGGLIVSNMLVGEFSESVPTPPPGTSVTLTLDAQVDFDVSLNGGGAFSHATAPVELTVQVAPGGVPGASDGYTTALLEFKPLGSLLGNLRLRQSSSQPSGGQVVFTPVPGGSGGTLISSFFNLVLDYSTDGGQTWHTMTAQHLDLKADPSNASEAALVAQPTPLFPTPDDQMLLPSVKVASFPSGIEVRGLRQTLFTGPIDVAAVPLGNSTMLPYHATLDFDLSLDGGQTFTRTRTSTDVSLSLTKIRESSSRLFDTEVTQMDFSAAVAGASIMFRESPSLSSYGGTELRSLADGTFQFSSFFDVFLEVSTDGGQTWAAASNGPLHFQLQPNSLRNQFDSSNLPAPSGQYVLPALKYQTGPLGGALIAGDTFTRFSASSPPPAAGQRLVQQFTAQVSLRISLDGGATYTDAAGTAAGQMLVTPAGINWGDTIYYDAELQQLNVTGLPQGILLRESPTLASTGRLSITALPTGNFVEDSFFDVYTELSVDGGQTWTAATTAGITVLKPPPPVAPLQVFCPADIVATATSGAGAVVTYPPLLYQQGDCPMLGGTPSIAYSPPSGTQFPIGTTTVTVTADNECGEHASCSFNVRVLPNLNVAREFVYARLLMPPPGAAFVVPAPFGPISTGGIIVSNLSIGSFAQSVPPPPAGTAATVETAATAQFDVSTDGGMTFAHGSAPARLVLNIVDTGPGQLPGQETYQFNLERLDISGGSLPTPVMARASMTQPSSGQVSIRSTPGTGPANALVIALLDVNLEFSSDGGQTWTPASSAVHFELRPDPSPLLPVPEFTPLWPPPEDQLSSPASAAVVFPGGVVLKNLHQAFFSNVIDLTLVSPSPVPVAQQISGLVQLQWSQDGGQTFRTALVPLSIGLLLQGPGSGQVIDVEVTQMDMSGGDLPATLLLRASPTLPSRGELAVQGFADGSFETTSFLDVFLEMSTDGGMSWQPASSGPLHLDLRGTGPVLSENSANLPPAGSQYVTPAGAPQSFPSATGAIIVIMDEAFSGYTSSAPPPAPGQTNRVDVRGQLTLKMSLDGGRTFNSYNALASAQFQFIGDASIDWGDRQYLRAQLLQFTATGGTLPSGMVLRQSPSRPALGRAGISVDAAGGFRVESFYNLSQELSADGGQSWNPAVEGQIWLVLNPPPGFVPWNVTCPGDITVYATSPSGAVVNFSVPPTTSPYPDCPLCCFDTTCTPPSGSLFPIGTTTVLCQGHDGCGETPTCSFNITVLQGTLLNGVTAAPLGSVVLWSPAHGTSGPISMVISNIGTSGQDGFHADLGSADSLALNFDPYPNYDITGMVSTVTGPYAGDPNHVLGMSAYQGGPNAMVMADFSPLGATSIVAQVTDENHNLLSSQTIPNGSWFNVNNLYPPGCTNPTSTVCTVKMGPGFTCWRFCRYGCTCEGTNCTIERVVCLFEVVQRVATIAAINFTAQGSQPGSSLIIQGAQVGSFGNLHTASGAATLQGGNGLLQVNGIGASGNDGVDLNLNHVGGLGISFAPLRLSAPNACLNFTAAGDVDGLPAVQAGALSLGGSGGTLALNGNFSGLGADRVSLEVYLNGQFQGGGILAGGLLGNLNLTGNLTAAGALVQQPGFWVRFAPAAGAGLAGFTFIGGGLNLSGDELRLSAANPTLRLGALTQFGIRSCNTGQIGLAGETVTPLIGRAIANARGTITLTGQGAARQIYRLEGTPALGPQTGWRTFASAQADDDGYVTLQDTPAAVQQFYRIAVPPGGGIDNLAFLQSVFQNLLNRNVDPGAQSYWLNYLASGGSRTNLVATITDSDEYRQALVQNTFNRFLHRAAQTSDLSYWDTFLQMGGTDEQFMAQIVGSPEYFTTRGGSSNEGFLQALYADLLARPLDSAAEQVYLQELASGTTTTQVATQVLGSAEYRQDLVANIYLRFLQRPPTSAEASSYSTLLASGGTDEQVIAFVAGSAAY